jgi:membrane dipeptidase
VNFFSAFVSQQYYDAFIKLQPEIAKAQAELDAKYKAQGKPTPYSEYDKLQREWAAKIPRPPFSALIDQIDHIAKVAGVDHVGIGSDFDGIPTSPEGIDTVADLPKISAALLQRGYSPEDVHKIMGGNLLRVFRQVEQVSRDLKSVEQRPRISQKQP